MQTPQHDEKSSKICFKCCTENFSACTFSPPDAAVGNGRKGVGRGRQGGWKTMEGGGRGGGTTVHRPSRDAQARLCPGFSPLSASIRTSLEGSFETRRFLPTRLFFSSRGGRIHGYSPCSPVQGKMASHCRGAPSGRNLKQIARRNCRGAHGKHRQIPHKNAVHGRKLPDRVFKPHALDITKLT